jgi:hypothetical protein
MAFSRKDTGRTLDLHLPEHFSFSGFKVVYKDVKYEGWVYYPHPEPKKRNFQNLPLWK